MMLIEKRAHLFKKSQSLGLNVSLLTWRRGILVKVRYYFMTLQFTRRMAKKEAVHVHFLAKIAHFPWLKRPVSCKCYPSLKVTSIITDLYGYFAYVHLTMTRPCPDLTFFLFLQWVANFLHNFQVSGAHPTCTNEDLPKIGSKIHCHFAKKKENKSLLSI